MSDTYTDAIADMTRDTQMLSACILDLRAENARLREALQMIASGATSPAIIADGVLLHERLRKISKTAPPDFPEAIRTRTGQTFYLCDDGGYRPRPTAGVGAHVGAEAQRDIP